MIERLSLRLTQGVDQRRFFDFVIAETPIYDLIRKSQEGLLWADNSPARIELIKKLTLELPSDFSNSRVAIYGCSECGDIYCGGISVRVVLDEKIVNWSDFSRFSYDHEEEQFVFQSIEYIEPYQFDLGQYLSAFEVAL